MQIERINVFQHAIIVVFTEKYSESIFGVHCKKRNKRVWMQAKCTSLKIQMNIHRDCFARDSLENPISKHIELNRKKKKKKKLLHQALHPLLVHNAWFSLFQQVTEQKKVGIQQYVSLFFTVKIYINRCYQPAEATGGIWDRLTSNVMKQYNKPRKNLLYLALLPFY